jgi:hypothetical protein
MTLLNDLRIISLLCLTLGLMPYFPEPHIWGKLKWIAGGAQGMQLIDWLDVLLHGFPFLLLIRWLYRKINSDKEKTTS